jgi:transcriptional regulator with XRE-family HTH domain
MDRHRLRELRQDALLTQVELAERAGIASWTLARIEQGAQQPRFGTIRKLAAALGVDPKELRPAASAAEQGRSPDA